MSKPQKKQAIESATINRRSRLNKAGVLLLCERWSRPEVDCDAVGCLRRLQPLWEFCSGGPSDEPASGTLRNPDSAAAGAMDRSARPVAEGGFVGLRLPVGIRPLLPNYG